MDYDSPTIKMGGLCFFIAAIIFTVGYSTQVWYSAVVCNDLTLYQYTYVGIRATTKCIAYSCSTTDTADLGDNFKTASLATPITGGIGAFFVLLVLMIMCCKCVSKTATRRIGLMSGFTTLLAAGLFAILGYQDISKIPGLMPEAKIGYSFYLVISAGILCLLSSFAIKLRC